MPDAPLSLFSGPETAATPRRRREAPRPDLMPGEHRSVAVVWRPSPYGTTMPDGTPVEVPRYRCDPCGAEFTSPSQAHDRHGACARNGYPKESTRRVDAAGLR